MEPQDGLELLESEVLISTGTPTLTWKTQLTVANLILWPATVVLLPLVIFAPLFAGMTFNWHRWWLTNQRVVVRTGFIGWSLRSIPLDRISDVTIRQGFWDQLFGTTHLCIRDMTGEVGSNGVSTGGNLYGVPDALATQQSILSLLQNTRALPTHQDSDVVALLGEIRDRLPPPAA